MPIDRLQRFSNQLAENRLKSCVGETVADIWGNVLNQPQDPDFSQAATFNILGVLPSTGGTSPLVGMMGAVIYGCLPTDKESFDATIMPPIFVDNFSNYTPPLKHLASLFPASGVSTLPLWEDVIDYLDEEKQGVALEMEWYASFLTPNPDGTLPPGSGLTTNHCVAVYGYDTRGLKIKPWLGAGYGQGGYAYLPEAMFPRIRLGAWAFNLEAIRWISLVRAWLNYPAARADIWPQLTPMRA